MLPIFYIVLIFFFVGAHRKGIGDTNQDWGYVEVRPHAHMFWWLYYTTAITKNNYTQHPLIVWLQGGPGMPSSGYGNFVEIGPLDVYLKNRSNSLINNFNVLFIDNPVGVGFSYISDKSVKLVNSGEAIGKDLVSFFKIFLKERPSIQTMPIYIFGESYGGKMAIEFIYQLLQEKDFKINNLKGVGLGDSYISPIDYVLRYGPLALQMGLIDKQSFSRIDELAKQIQILISQKEFKEAADIEDKVTEKAAAEMLSIDVYNILVHTNTTLLPRFTEHMDTLEYLTNKLIKPKLGLNENVTWRFFSTEIHDALKGDLMRSVIEKVETILNETNIKIIVYNGNLDFIVNTAGTISWLDKLRWPGKSEWLQATPIPLEINQIYEGYYKKCQNLSFYSILRAGHSVPVDNMKAMNEMIYNEIINDKN